MKNKKKSTPFNSTGLTKKYFLGGMANQGVSSGAEALGLNSSASKTLGNTAQMATGLATGNVQDIIQGGVGSITQGFSNAASIFKNKDATFKDKALGVAGLYGPLGQLAGSGVMDKLENIGANRDEFNSLIKNTNMANGGQVSQADPHWKVEQQYLKSMYGKDPRIKMVGDSYILETPDAPEQPSNINRSNANWFLDDNIENNYQPQDSTLLRGQPAPQYLPFQQDTIPNPNQPFNNMRTSVPLANGGSLLEFGGFSHDDQDPNNVNEGNLIKVDADGNNHVTEAGETMKDGYVFSDKLTVPKAVEGLPKKYVGKTFAQASKLINKSFEERPNDSIVKRTKQSQLDLLTQQNDITRELSEQQEELSMRCGGRMYFKGGKINEGDYDMDDLSPEEVEFLKSKGYNVEIQ